jgi:hypothetical protein
MMEGGRYARRSGQSGLAPQLPTDIRQLHCLDINPPTSSSATASHDLHDPSLILASPFRLIPRHPRLIPVFLLHNRQNVHRAVRVWSVIPQIPSGAQKLIVHCDPDRGIK